MDNSNGTGNGQVLGYALASGVPGTTPTAGTPAATGNPPFGMAIDPTGVLLAVVNNGSNTIFPFTIDSSGALTVDTLVGTGSAPLRVTFNDAP